jgi:hypothetical protein
MVQRPIDPSYSTSDFIALLGGGLTTLDGGDASVDALAEHLIEGNVPLRPPGLRTREGEQTIDLTGDTLPGRGVDVPQTGLLQKVLVSTEQASHVRSKSSLIFARKRLEVTQSIECDTTEFRVAREFSDCVRDVAGGRLEGSALNSPRILPDLPCEIDQGNDNANATKKVADVSKRFEHGVAPPNYYIGCGPSTSKAAASAA